VKLQVAAALAALIVGTPALAQTAAQTIEALVSSGPAKTDAPMPDPSHVPIVFGKELRWTGDAASKRAVLFGDPAKPGIYGLLIKWEPGHYSQPHFHSTERYAYVVAGTWWVSSSKTWDPARAYPVPAGSYVRDLANTVHWDGAKDQPCLLLLVGTGPMTTTELPRP
jgi:quercetin dioxygenase-like cupin family protein